MRYPGSPRPRRGLPRLQRRLALPAPASASPTPLSGHGRHPGVVVAVPTLLVLVLQRVLHLRQRVLVRLLGILRVVLLVIGHARSCPRTDAPKRPRYAGRTSTADEASVISFTGV